MKRKLLEILACPMDKHHPLELREFEAENDEILSGLLLCSECGRFYTIVDRIPTMLPDQLRNKKWELDFLERWKAKLPPEVSERGRPFNLE